MATEGTTRGRDNLTADEVIERVFADDDSKQENSFFLNQTDNIHSGTSIRQATRGRGL